jgi:hypothetical protein
MYKYLILITVIIYSCKSEKRNIEYTEKEKGDSILYFKSFDLNLFKGINKLKYDSLNYPFVKLVYDSGKLILKVHYNEKKTHQISFFKLQNKWCSHSSYYYDGLREHAFLISLDSALLRLRYSRNPLDNNFEYPADLKEVMLSKNVEDTLLETNLQLLDKNLSKIPDLNSFNFESFKKNCGEVSYTKLFLYNDSITSMYLSILNDDHYDTNKKRWSVYKEASMANSIFLTNFEKLKEGNNSD